jgi:hypothetical protein
MLLPLIPKWCLLSAQEPLLAPLTTFTSESLQAEALKLFKVMIT